MNLTAEQQQALDRVVAAYQHALVAEGITGAELADNVTRYRQMCVEVGQLVRAGLFWPQKSA
jgi:hypothetical protein